MGMRQIVMEMPVGDAGGGAKVVTFEAEPPQDGWVHCAVGRGVAPIVSYGAHCKLCTGPLSTAVADALGSSPAVCSPACWLNRSGSRPSSAPSELCPGEAEVPP